MSDVRPLWIREAEVVHALDLAGAIAALEAALAAEARGAVAHLEKTHAAFGAGDTLHALGAIIAGRRTEEGAAPAGGEGATGGLAGGLAGTKTWAHTRGGATPLLVLWRADDGALVAVIEAFALGQLRTSGVSAVATRVLADPAADELAIVGTGKQALPQVAAVAAVRRLRHVRAFSPTPAHRERLAARIGAELGVPARAVGSVAECTRGAPVVTVVTRATEPFLGAGDLERGAHLNAVGAITPERAEIAGDVFARADLVVADSPAQALRLSRELRDAYGAAAADGAIAARDTAALRPPLVALCEVVAGRVARPRRGDLTLFKAMGMGLADVALGAAVVERARALGLGRELDHPERAAPRLLTAPPNPAKPGTGASER